jgi:hypothetical protein
MRKISGWFILGILIVVAGCQTNFDTDELPSGITPESGGPLLSTPQPVSTTQGEIMTPFTPPIPNVENLIEMAKKDLAQRLAISANEINLVEAKSVVWPDTSLGCPQEGMGYAQVITPGYLILLKYAGAIFEYHAGSGNYIVTCDNPSPPVPGVPGDT